MILRDPKTRIVPVWRSRNLFSEIGGNLIKPKPAFLNTDETIELINISTNQVYLGKETFKEIDIPYLAIDISSLNEDKAKSKLAIATQKTKASGAKLKQTLFESKNKAFKGDDFTFSPSKAGKGKQPRDKRMGGGFMGKRMGYKLGTKKKSNVEKIKKTFGPKSLGMQSVIYGLDKNKNITAADPKATFIAAANKKKKKKVI